jgi:hypothetical protein
MIVISPLGTGGLARVRSIMASHWAERGRVAAVVTLELPAP